MKLPVLPPVGAQRFNTVCQFCIVGCGYQVLKWPEAQSGGPEPHQNALGLDLTKAQAAFGTWIAPNQHRVITEHDGSRHHIVIVPDNACRVNDGMASVRGAGLAQTLYAPDQPTRVRLSHPLLDKGVGLEKASWDESVDLGARVIQAVIDRWGADAVGMKFFDHGGGGGGFENNWAVGRFFFSAIGTRTASIHNRPAYNSEVHASADAGVAALSNSYLDAQLADTLVIVGANPYETQTNYFLAHMVPNLQGATVELKTRTFTDEQAQPGRIIIIDPRKTMTVATAIAAAGPQNVLHLAIEPGGDIAVLNGIARAIVHRRWHDVGFIRQHTETQTYEAYLRSSLGVDQPYDTFMHEASRISGVSVLQMEKAAAWIAQPKAAALRRRTLLHYEKGLIWGLKNYENVAAIVDLGLLTGSVGKPGTGISRLGGHQEGYVRPAYPGGRPALNVDEAIRRGEVKALWIGGCNPVLTTSRAKSFEAALKERGAPVRKALKDTANAPMARRISAVVQALKDGGMFIIGQDIYLSESARHAHIVLAAAQWGEANLTSINGERRLRLYPKFMDPPGQALADWAIMARFAKRLRSLYQADNNTLMANRFVDFDWRKDEDVFIHARYSFKGDASDPMEGYAGVTYDLLRRLGNNGIQTPVRMVAGTPVGTVRMHEDGRFSTPTGKARFIAAPLPWPGYAAAVSTQRKNHRFWVNNGRSNHIWQTSYHHRHIPFYNDRFPIPYIEMHPQDAKSLGISSGDLVEVFNDIGSVQAMAYVGDAVKVGHTFMLFGQPRGTAGDLISDHVDPSTTIPYYKGVWANIKRLGPMPDALRSTSLAPTNVAS